MKNLINEKTALPISLVISIIIGVVWLTNVANRAVANTASIEKIEKKADVINDIKEDVAVIKEKITQIERSINRRH